LEDYLNVFLLHLPEIYEETLRIEALVKAFRKNLDKAVLTRLEVSLEHMARNHISFVRFALEWAADESSWEAPKNVGISRDGPRSTEGELDAHRDSETPLGDQWECSTGRGSGLF
jgi:hypothetical protein